MTVMITGESGTGKELVARSIWKHSHRAAKPFIAVNCAAIPDNLIESELFGHEKGSFTGATGQRLAKFELCDGGTIFLDEIGDMAFATQTKILRVLQQGEIQRVGGTDTIRVDVRIIAATNKDLLEEIRGGRFREDLFFRLNVIPIHVPALRERGDDIIVLARHFVGEVAREYGRRLKQLAPEAEAVLRAFRWPGNVRELRNVIERVMIMVPGDTITAADLAFLGVTAPAHLRPPQESETPLTVAPLYTARDDWEREYIRVALSVCDGNISRTADMLGVERSNLYRKMKGLGLETSRN